MSSGRACDRWLSLDCEGTDACPPRCPRFVTSDGAAITITEKSGDDPSTVSLVAEEADGVVGQIAIASNTGEARLTCPESVDEEIGIELIRQAIAWCDPVDHDRLTVAGPDDILTRFEAEYESFATVTDGDLSIALSGDLTETIATLPSSDARVAEPPMLDELFDPDSVAVVGATDRPGAIGRVVVENVMESFDGKIVPVTDRHDTVFDVPAVDSPSELDESVDLAVVVLPAELVLETMAELGAAGVRTVAVLSAGFGETDATGRQREEQLTDIATRHDMTVIGPNALGIISTRSGLNASFAPTMPTQGGVSIMSHSGAMITAMLDWADRAGVGIRDAVSLGNTAGIDEADLLRYWGPDSGTDVVMAYLEDVSDGRAFVEAAQAVTPTTPVVVLHAGRSDAGTKAAAAHTGALTGDTAAYDAAFDAGGIVSVQAQHDLFDAVKGFVHQPVPTGNCVAIVTNAGGPGVLASDAAASCGLNVPSLSDATAEALDDRLPDAANATNPIDVLGDADTDRIADSLEIVLQDPGIDAVILASTPHPLVSFESLAPRVASLSRRYAKPIVVTFGGGAAARSVVDTFQKRSIPTFTDPRRAAFALSAMATHDTTRLNPVDRRQPSSFDPEMVEAVVQHLDRTESQYLGVADIELLEKMGLSVPPGAVAYRPDSARPIAEAIGEPVAIKSAASSIPHKAAVGGVTLDVAPEAVEETVASMLSELRREDPTVADAGVYLQAMVSDGAEVFVGVSRDVRFGPLLTIGLGGTAVEQLDAVEHELAPVAPRAVDAMIDRNEPLAATLSHVGADSTPRDEFAHAVSRLSHVFTDAVQLDTLEINPMMVGPDGITAVDLFAIHERS